MQTIKISATKARNNFFELLNQVALGREIIIEKDNKEIAMLTPKRQKMDWVKFRKAAEKARGIFKDLSPEEIAPVRKKGNWRRLGKWDKGLEEAQ